MVSCSRPRTRVGVTGGPKSRHPTFPGAARMAFETAASALVGARPATTLQSQRAAGRGQSFAGDANHPQIAGAWQCVVDQRCREQLPALIRHLPSVPTLSVALRHACRSRTFGSIRNSDGSTPNCGAAIPIVVSSKGTATDLRVPRQSPVGMAVVQFPRAFRDSV